MQFAYHAKVLVGAGVAFLRNAVSECHFYSCSPSAMDRKPHDPHGNAPDWSKSALLLIDVINDFDFPEADQLLEFAVPMAKRIERLKQQAKQAGLPVIYVNDNFGRWQSDFKSQVEYCFKQTGRGREVVERLQPEDQDYFVLKPRHSGFYSTTLETLLDYFGVEKLIQTGLATNICVLFTANDAYMRGYELYVPRDCVASNTTEENDNALRQMEKVLKANITPADDIDWQALLE